MALTTGDQRSPMSSLPHSLRKARKSCFLAYNLLVPNLFRTRLRDRVAIPINCVLLASTVLAVVSYAFYVTPEQGLRLNLVDPHLLSERLREGNVRARERQGLIERLFGEVGCTVSRQPIDTKSANVICDLPGETSATIVIGAHFDFVDEGRGIVDDWSGASMLVSLYQTLKSQALKHSYEFVAFAAEERGLVGSTRYVKELKTKPSPTPEAFVNLECLGLTPPKVWLTRSNPMLVQRLIAVASAMHIPLQGVDVDRVGDDDTHPFLSKKIPVISIHSVTQETCAGFAQPERQRKRHKSERLLRCVPACSLLSGLPGYLAARHEVRCCSLTVFRLGS